MLRILNVPQKQVISDENCTSEVHNMSCRSSWVCTHQVNNIIEYKTYVTQASKNKEVKAAAHASWSSP